jgi:hypothetical protein
VPEPNYIIITPGAGDPSGGFVLHPGGASFRAIMDEVRRLAGEAAAVTLDAGFDITGDGAGAMTPSAGGAILVYDQPVSASFTSPVDMRIRQHRPDPWFTYQAAGVTRLFVPCPAWSQGRLSGTFYVFSSGGWSTQLGSLTSPGDRPRWAALWSPRAGRLGPGWLETVLARYLTPCDTRPGWPPPRIRPAREAASVPPNADDPVWHKPPKTPLPAPSKVVVYLPSGGRLELGPEDPRCAPILTVVEATLNSVFVGRSTTYELPPGLYQAHGAEPNWPGVLLIWNTPASIRTTTPIEPEFAPDLIVAWGEATFHGVLRAYFPALVAGATAPPFGDAAYILDQPGLEPEPAWGVGSSRFDKERQSALGEVVAGLDRP